MCRRISRRRRRPARASAGWRVFGFAIVVRTVGGVGRGGPFRLGGRFPDRVQVEVVVLLFDE
jgi:hypothetical protein